jgi:hypothetical protein
MPGPVEFWSQTGTFSWSPDSSRVFFAPRPGHVVAVDVATGERQELDLDPLRTDRGIDVRAAVAVTAS